jgi:hypothetical protein
VKVDEGLDGLAERLVETLESPAKPDGRSAELDETLNNPVTA